jgi:hypothetical protein
MGFSFFRGLLLSALFPLVACLAMGATNSLISQGQPFDQAVRDASVVIGNLYHQYPMWALVLHVLVFLRGSAFTRFGRRPTSMPLLLIILFIGGGLWLAQDRLGIDLARALPSLPGSTPVAKDFPDLQPIANPAPPVNPLALVQTNPNRLHQPVSRVVDKLNILPTTEGNYAVSGYLGSSAVVWLINADSPVTAAPAQLSSAAARCENRNFTMDGKEVSGCVGIVEDLYLGHLALSKVEVFFTSQLPMPRAIIGSAALKKVVLTKGEGASIQISQRRTR